MIADFLATQEVVFVGGAGVRVGPPTVGTVYLALALYDAQILAAAKMVYRTGVDLGDDPTGALISVLVSRPEAARRVLMTCTEGLPASAGPADLARVARACIASCDLTRLVQSLRLDAAIEVAEEGAPEPAGVTAVEKALVRVAKEFGQPPHAVAEWPYLSFLGTLEVLEAMALPSPEDNEAALKDPILNAVAMFGAEGP